MPVAESDGNSAKRRRNWGRDQGWVRPHMSTQGPALKPKGQRDLSEAFRWAKWLCPGGTVRSWPGTKCLGKRHPRNARPVRRARLRSALSLRDRDPTGLNKVMKATIVGLRLLFCAPKGLQNSAQGFNPGNRPPRATRPHKALPRSALLGKHPVRRVGGAEGAPDRTCHQGGTGSDGTSQLRIPTFARQ